MSESFVNLPPLRVWSEGFVGLELLAGATNLRTFPLHNYVNGRLRGNFHQDGGVATILIEQGSSQGVMDLSFTVTQDVSQPNFQYPFDVIIIQPFVRISYTNGGAPNTFARVDITALPI
jgi:hypothetical protein